MEQATEVPQPLQLDAATNQNLDRVAPSQFDQQANATTASIVGAKASIAPPILTLDEPAYDERLVAHRDAYVAHNYAISVPEVCHSLLNVSPSVLVSVLACILEQLFGPESTTHKKHLAAKQKHQQQQPQHQHQQQQMMQQQERQEQRIAQQPEEAPPVESIAQSTRLSRYKRIEPVSRRPTMNPSLAPEATPIEAAQSLNPDPDPSAWLRSIPIVSPDVCTPLPFRSAEAKMIPDDQLASSTQAEAQSRADFAPRITEEGQDSSQFEFSSDAENVQPSVAPADAESRLDPASDAAWLSQKKLSPFHSDRIPSISITDYIHRIAQYSESSPEAIIMSIMHILRIEHSYHSCVPVSPYSIHRLLLTSVLVTCKFFDDSYFNNKFFARIGGISTQEMNQLELAFLLTLRYDLNVQPVVFETFIAELCNAKLHPKCSCRHSELDQQLNRANHIVQTSN